MAKGLAERETLRSQPSALPLSYGPAKWWAEAEEAENYTYAIALQND